MGWTDFDADPDTIPSGPVRKKDIGFKFKRIRAQPYNIACAMSLFTDSLPFKAHPRLFSSQKFSTQLLDGELERWRRAAGHVGCRSAVRRVRLQP